MPRFGQNQFASRLFADYASADSAFSDSFHMGRGASLFTPSAAISDGRAAAGVTAFKSGTGFVVEGLPGSIGSSVIGPLGTDDAGDAIGAPPNPTITVGAPVHYVGTLGTIGDQDYYTVTLEAGKTYEIGMFGWTGGPNFIPVQDSYLELYNAAGQIQGSADGGASTLVNQANSGFDAVLTFTVTASGTYYINARAFDNNPANGSTGEGVGDYELYVNEVDPNAPGVYHPYYDASSPLYAIDWGTQVDKVNHTDRNPDGNEGTRSTGNSQGTPTQAAQFHYDPDGDGPQAIQTYNLAGLAAAQGKDVVGKNVVTIYFARPGDVFVSNNPANPGLPPATITAVAIKDFEYTAVWTSLAEFAKVADVVYLEVSDRADADFIYSSYSGTPGPGVSLLGSMSPPGEDDEGLAQFNSADERWNATSLAQGGFSFVTLIHEFGHGHGLAHPHDNGGHSGIMNGVEPEGAGVADYTTGDYDLNQGVFTMMSYEDGWQTSPHTPKNAATTAGYGYLGGLMAFDIAAIQDKYGVNEDYNIGDNTYTINDTNAAGTYYYSIWDAGGTDEIVYSGARDSNIDLRPASLEYETGGGGWVSYALNIYGGFTIANGVTIENATSGSGNDTLRGNAVGNILDGGAGNDLLLLNDGGNDTAKGGAGNDVLYFGSAFTGADKAEGGEGRDGLVLQGNYSLTFSATNMSGLEALSLQTGSNDRWGDTANNSYDYDITLVDENVEAGVQMIVNGQSLLAGEDLTFDGSAETDGKFLIFGGHGVDDLTGGGGGDVFYFEHDRWGPNDKVDGGDGRDGIVLSAGNGLNHFEFGEDSLTNIEAISVNNRFANDRTATPSYELVLSNGNVAPGATLIVNAVSLENPVQTVTFDGSAVHDGKLIMFGGAGSDVLIGGLQADTFTGGGGSDTFRYTEAGQSTATATDRILDFASGSDRIDLATIDADSSAAGDQAFHWIGANAFSGTGAASAGELRAYQSGGDWFVEGDVDGNGVADLVIQLVAPVGAVAQGDFML